MIDLELIRTDLAGVRANLERRQRPEYLELLELVHQSDATWRALRQDADALRRTRNELSRRIAERRTQGQASPELDREAKELPEKMRAIEEKEAALLAERDVALKRLPNLLDPSVPFGKDDHDNVTVATWGDPVKDPGHRKSHVELLEELGMAEFERAHRASGAGFYYLKGPVVLLDLALQRFALDLLTERGFTPVEPPFMLRRAPYEGVTDLADFENVMYHIEGEDLYLIATSEHPLAALYQGEILDDAGISMNFRKEIGGHGVDQKGIFRTHQFAKVEQFVFCRPEDSPQIHEEIRTNAEEVFRRLGVPYRVVNPPRKGGPTRKDRSAHPQLDRRRHLPRARRDP
ncbi:MAG: serine--tRNA ligase [Thermoplasmatales archaeon]|nr:serine--tRNA ligase [Thermoplasmatales archaeon]